MWRQRQPKPSALKVCFWSFHSKKLWDTCKFYICFHECSESPYLGCSRTHALENWWQKAASVPYKQSSERAANVVFILEVQSKAVRVWTQSSFTITEEGGWWWKCSDVDKGRLRIRPGWLPVTSWDQSVWHQGKWGEAATLTLGYQLTFEFLIMAVLRALISESVYACSQQNKQI